MKGQVKGRGQEAAAAAARAVEREREREGWQDGLLRTRDNIVAEPKKKMSQPGSY